MNDSLVTVISSTVVTWQWCYVNDVQIWPVSCKTCHLGHVLLNCGQFFTCLLCQSIGHMVTCLLRWTTVNCHIGHVSRKCPHVFTCHVLSSTTNKSNMLALKSCQVKHTEYGMFLNSNLNEVIERDLLKLMWINFCINIPYKNKFLDSRTFIFSSQLTHLSQTQYPITSTLSYR